MKPVHVNSADLTARIKEIRSVVTETKQVFIAPKRDFERAIEQDTMYLVALGEYIDQAQKKLAVLDSGSQKFEASKLRVELYEAIGKYQANNQLVVDKETHFNNVFLPMYDKELEESAKNFRAILEQSKDILIMESEGELAPEFASKTALLSSLKNELGKYEENSALHEDPEYKNFVYKTLKRIVNSFGN
jgi:hypothetical protein